VFSAILRQPARERFRLPESRAVVSEAPLERSESGLVPRGEGWFVVNAREARWFDSDFGPFTRFEGDGDARFKLIGVNIGILHPGQPACMYHGEDEQENFLILSGECLLLVEGEERRLQAWDFVHCPPWTEHVFVGTGDEPCLMIAVGTRKPDDQVIYPVADVALKHDAGVATETDDPKVAYAGVSNMTRIPYPAGALPDVPPPRV
jgi:uncharacterized cupin superfamily protein